MFALETLRNKIVSLVYGGKKQYNINFRQAF